MSDAPSIVTTLDERLPRPHGFTFGATHCGIKQARPDLALVRSAVPAAAAGVFTQNPARAPSVERDAALVPRDGMTAVVINSGNANAMTGERGIADNDRMAQHGARALGVAADQVITMSTGVVGVPLPIDRVTEALPALVASAGEDPAPVARAILTTDTCTKVAGTTVRLPGSEKPVRVLGIAKGSGMIHPNMATTLAVVCTDAAIDATRLQALLSAATPGTFNAICVDGDTSTNDAVVVLANGASGVSAQSSSAEATLGAAITEVLGSLARQVVRDGEGATRVMEVEVRGAPSDEAARLVARGVCRSSLVKCSTFAGQADWGRIAAAAGQAILEHGLAIDPRRAAIAVQGIELYSDQGPRDTLPEAELRRRMRDSTVRWSLHVGDGPGRALALGCDLSYDYVRINADEAQQIEVTAQGVVRRAPGLDGYSPRHKHQLLVDGLAYVRRFTGLRVMVHVPPPVAAESDDDAAPDALDADRVDTLARDLELCLDAGLRPLLVVPSEAIASRVREHMKTTGHYCESVDDDPRAIVRMLDRGYLGVLVDTDPRPERTVDRAIALGVHKLIVMGLARGLRDRAGSNGSNGSNGSTGTSPCVSSVHCDTLLAGLAEDRFWADDPRWLPLAEHAARRGIHALHLLDLRVPHALVGELFTDEGIGTLVTRQVTD